MSPWHRKSKLSKKEVARTMEDFLMGVGKPLAWDGFTLGMTFEDDYLEGIRLRCARLTEEIPPEHPNEYCNGQGRDVIREYIRLLRTSN